MQCVNEFLNGEINILISNVKTNDLCNTNSHKHKYAYMIFQWFFCEFYVKIKFYWKSHVIKNIIFEFHSPNQNLNNKFEMNFNL
jgi:hypothetical protein